MAKTENETKKEVVAKGLQIRTFNGKIAAAKDGSTPEIPYKYDRMVLPWSRTGTDHEDKPVTGAVPSLAQIMDWVAKSGFTVEFVLDGEGNPTNQSAVGFLIDGINSYLNITSRVKATNTKESALEKSIGQFMKLGLSRDQAIAQIKAMVEGL